MSSPNASAPPASAPPASAPPAGTPHGPTPFSATAPLTTGGLLLEASAGTGKTYCITSLVLRLVVEHDVRIEQILAVTFTNAATAELRDRVRRRLQDALEAVERAYRADRLRGTDAAAPGDEPTPDARPPDAIVDHLVDLARGHVGYPKVLGPLRAALEGFDRAPIFTIHGFCQRMLAQNALASGVAFETTLIEDERALIHQVVRDLWQRELHDAPPRVHALLDGLGLDFPAACDLGELAVAYPDADLVPSPPDADPAPPALPRLDAARAALDARWWKDHRRARALIDEAARHGALRANFPLGDLDRADDAARALTRGDLARPHVEALRLFDAGFLARATRPGATPPTHPLFDLVAEARAAWIAEIPDAVDFVLAFRHRLIRDTRAAVRRRREAASKRSFDDLLRLLRDALAAPDGAALAHAIRRQFKAALIDEFQDTDPIQWEIFQRLFAGRDDRWLYLIGDPKQAIYRFRGADIHTYLRAKRALAERSATLATSYRADRRLVTALNALFSPPGAFATPGIDYVPVAAHHGDDRAAGISAPLVVRFVPRPNPDKPLTGRWVQAHLPARVAADVAARLNAGVVLTDARGERPERTIRPSDCAVLVRTNAQAADIQRALRAAGIPSVIHGPDSVFSTDEATELARLLAAVLEPARVTLARTALASPLLGGTAARVDAVAHDASAWEAWVGELRGWQRLWLGRGFVHLFRALIAGRLAALLSLEDGERRVANLLHLGELLHHADVTEELAPAGLLDWLHQRRRGVDPDAPAEPLRLESDADAVDIVTIHKSKGLEYPLVWCPYLALPYGPQRRARHVLFRDPADDHAEKLDVAPERSEWKAHRALVDYEYAAEGLRLLYVALTRARHQVTFWWGGFHDAHRSPLWLLLDGGAGVTDAESLAAARDETVNDRDDARLRAPVEALAAASGGAIALELDRPRDIRWSPDPSPAPTQTPKQPEGSSESSLARSLSGSIPPTRPTRPTRPTAADALAARVYARATPIDNAWRRTSFSGLTRHLDYHAETSQPAEDEAPVHETEAGDGLVAPPLTPTPSAARVPLHDLPGGRHTGNFLHEVLEHADFGGPTADLEALVRGLLPRHGLEADPWTEPVTAALEGVLATPLDEGPTPLRLRDLPRARRLDEIAFTFPLAGGAKGRGKPAFSPARLAAVFEKNPSPSAPRAWVDRLAGLGFLPARGFVTGAIDLVFSDADGRFWVVDYKSNHLGAYVADYGRADMERAMTAHHYHLQHHLYSVALVRYLRARMPDFDFARHFGGVLYLFLRGMAPGHPPGTGVYRASPPEALINALSACLDGAEAG